jgi:hypothetical protein
LDAYSVNAFKEAIIRKLMDEIKEIKRAVLPPADHRPGSSVETVDFDEKFAFTLHQIDVTKDTNYYNSWTPSQFANFKNNVKTKLIEKN